MNVFTSEQMRQIDIFNETKNISAITLMGLAGCALAEAVSKEEGQKIAVFCGTGNNGGDGFAAVQNLSKSNKDITVFLAGEPKTQAAKYYYECIKNCGVNITQYDGQNIQGFDIVIDALLGTGLNDDVKGIYCQIINAINSADAKIISADIPSGLNADNGLVMGVCVKADITVTFVGYKLGHFFNDGADMCGKIILDGIGAIIPQENYVAMKRDFSLPARKKSSHKGNYANIKIIAGSDTMCGAAFMAHSSCMAALRSGAGMVTLAVPSSIKCAYMGRVTESMLFFLQDENGKIKFCKEEIDILLAKADVLIIGMGLGTSFEVGKILQYVLKNYDLTMIIDADGLNSLNIEWLLDTKCKVILTPHIGEFSRLCGRSIQDIRQNSVNIAQEFCQKYKCELVLKSNATIILNGAKTHLNAVGTPAQAKGGSGDVLAGVLGAFCGIMPIFDAAVYACYVCGSAAVAAEKELGSYSVLASDIIKNIPIILKKLTKK